MEEATCRIALMTAGSSDAGLRQVFSDAGPKSASNIAGRIQVALATLGVALASGSVSSDCVAVTISKPRSSIIW
jgi:hypothetical protein